MHKIRDYFIGDYLRSTSDVIEQARIIFIYRIILVALGLVTFLMPSLIINENYAQLIRSSVVWILFLAVLFTLRKYHSMRFATHALLIISTANIWVNTFIVFQEVNAISSLLATLAILYSFYYLRRRWALVYTLLNTLPIFILLTFQQFDAYHIPITPEKVAFDEYYISLIILFMLFTVILWHFRTAFNLSSQKLQDALNEQKVLTQRYQSMSNELLAAKEKAEEMNRLKDSFLANMSHEIRTPINGILGIAQIIEEETVDLKMKEYTVLLRKSGMRLLETITSILELAKLESEKPDLQLSPICVDRMIQASIASIKVLAEEKGISLIYKSGESTLVCLGDEVLLQQMLYHIIGNAVKFTEKGEILIETALYPTDHQYISVKVIDTGVGISEAFIPQLFQPFVQESSGQSRQFEGSGLGLSIAKKYVKLIGGDILVKSKKGVGSTFEMLLPQYAKDNEESYLCGG